MYKFSEPGHPSIEQFKAWRANFRACFPQRRRQRINWRSVLFHVAMFVIGYAAGVLIFHA